MFKHPKTSRHGLALCPACRAHVDLTAALANAVDATCPHCHAELATAPRSRSWTASGRSGLIAASLMGISVGGLGCDPGDSNPPITGDSVTVDSQGQADGKVDGGAETTPDIIIQPPYGIPPDPDGGDQGPEPADTPDTSEPSQDIGPAPAYGIPPEEF